MLSLKTLSSLEAPLDQRRRLLQALKALGWSHEDAARRIHRNTGTVKMALSTAGGKYRERVFIALEEAINQEAERK